MQFQTSGPWSPRTYRLMIVFVVFVCYFFWYPTTYRCRHHPFRLELPADEGLLMHFVCLDPEFDVPCDRPSLARGDVFFTCRSFDLRPVKVVDLAAIEQQRCEADLGVMVTYQYPYGCTCIPFGKLVDDGSYCAWSELYCSRVYGSGAEVIDPAPGYQFECGCGTGYTLNAATRRCEAAES